MLSPLSVRRFEFSLPLALALLGGFVAFGAACGGSTEEGRGAQTPSSSASARGGLEDAGSILPPGSDPICGDKWKWDGTRCVQLATDENAANAQGGGSGARHGENLPEGDAARSAASGASNDGAHLVVKDIKVGDGAEAKAGSMVRIHYVGTLQNGTEFDSSRKRGVPFEFRLGSGQVIRGFEKAVTGMKVGGIRKVTIPPELGYGRKGAPPIIPPNATLEFEIELIDAT